MTISVVPALRDTAEGIMITPNSFSPISPCYCTSTATIDSLSDIGQFSIGPMTNPSLAPPLTNNTGVPVGYSNFDTLSSIPTFYKGQSYPVSAQAKFFQNAPQNGWAKVWIDYNHDLGWDSLSENILNSPAIAPNYNAAGTFTIPTIALPGPTRLRVVYNMLGAPTGTQACGTYNYGETEDYIVNILAPGPHDPALTDIQVTPTVGCLDSSSTAIISIQNSGSQTLDLSINPLIIRLNVRGPNGLNVYMDTLNSGLLQPFTANNTFAILSPINMHAGGTYAINTDTLYLMGSANTNYVNDSLFKAVEITNSRPQNVDYSLCPGGIIPVGQGLKTINCSGTVLDSIVVPFSLNFSGNTVPTPYVCAPHGSGNFGVANLPVLPNSAMIVRSEIKVSNLSLDSPINLHNASDVRFSLFPTWTGFYFSWRIARKYFRLHLYSI